MPVSHARAAVSSLLVRLADITDPRDPREVRHPLVAVLGVAVAATLAGAASYRELGSVAAGLPQELLSLLGARRDLAGLVFIAPSAGTLRRVLIALDAGELDRAVGAWLREHAGCDADGWAIALDGKDLRGSWNDDGRLVLFSAMTQQTERQDAVVLGQITVPEGIVTVIPACWALSARALIRWPRRQSRVRRLCRRPAGMASTPRGSPTARVLTRQAAAQVITVWAASCWASRTRRRCRASASRWRRRCCRHRRDPFCPGAGARRAAGRRRALVS